MFKCDFRQISLTSQLLFGLKLLLLAVTICNRLSLQKFWSFQSSLILNKIDVTFKSGTNLILFILAQPWSAKWYRRLRKCKSERSGYNETKTHTGTQQNTQTARTGSKTPRDPVQSRAKCTYLTVSRKSQAHLPPERQRYLPSGNA